MRKLRRTFNRLALAVIQARDKPGPIHVQAVSPGLKSASLEIITKKIDTPVETIESLKK